MNKKTTTNSIKFKYIKKNLISSVNAHYPMQVEVNFAVIYNFDSAT